MERQNCSVKDMLTQGATPEELMASLQAEIDAAQAELNAETTATDNALETAREEAANALINYMIALDVIPEEVAAEITTEDVVEMMIELEEQIRAYAALMPLIAMLGDTPTPVRGHRAPIAHPTDEDILKKFLKSLK